MQTADQAEEKDEAEFKRNRLQEHSYVRRRS